MVFEFRGVSVGPFDDGTARSMLPARAAYQVAPCSILLPTIWGQPPGGAISRLREALTDFFSVWRVRPGLGSGA